MKLATIGTSWITDQFIEAAKQTPEVELIAVYSRKDEQAEAFAQKHEVSMWFSNMLEMAKSSAYDCVYIASPNSLHFEQAMLFLEHGKHVICEKPIFSTTAEWKTAHKLAEEKGVFLFEAIKNIHVPNAAIVKEKLSAVGHVRNVLLHFNKYSSRYNNVLQGEEPNIFSPAFSGGALVDLGVYPIALAVYLFGVPQTVTYSPVMLPTGIDGSGTLVMTYPDFVCTILCSKISTSYIESEIQGEQGTISVDNIGSLERVRLTDNRKGKSEDIGLQQAAQEMVYELDAFYRIIRENNQTAYSELSQHSFDVLSITEAARKQSGIVFACEQ